MASRALDPEFLDRLSALARLRASDLARLTRDRQLSALGLDSLSLAEMLVDLEQAFGVTLGLSDMERLSTVGDLHDLLMRAEPPAAQAAGVVPEAHYRIDCFPEVRHLEERVQEARRLGFVNPYFPLHEGAASPVTTIGGRAMLSFSNYNYLGLNGHPEVTAGAREAMERHGTSACASRLVAGELPVHRALERELADFLGCEAAVVMVSGHATNVTTISHLVGPSDLVLYDALIHNSVVQGAIASGAERRAFPHNDMDGLESMLGELRPAYRRVLLVAEGVYSMDGDICDLAGLVALKERHRCLLMVDEAHSLGPLGATGRGVGEHHGVERGRVDVWMGTLSKSLGSCGGYIAGSRRLVDYLKFTAPGFVYSVGMPPASAGAALAALRVLRREPQRVARLQQRSRLFLDRVRLLGCNLGNSGGSPIVPVILGNLPLCCALTSALAERGIHALPILFPAVEESASRVRFFISSEHTEEQLIQAADTLGSVLARLQGSPRMEEARA